MANRVVHFEIHATDSERAQRFNGDVFAWSLPRWMEDPPYWGGETADEGSEERGIDGGLNIFGAHLPHPDAK